MAPVYGRSDTGSEFSTPSRKRRIYGGDEDIDRIKQQSAHLQAMGALSSPTTPNGTSMLERLLQLEQNNYSPRGLAADSRSPSSPSSLFSSPSAPSSLERRCRPAKSVLLETEAKGTLVERIQRLERRISQHSMDLEKAFSSGRFSSSRFEPRYWESDHIREDSEHTESPSHRNSWSNVQETDNSKETYDNNLEVPPVSNLSSEKNGKAEPKQFIEDAATREMHRELEDKPSTPSPTVEEQTDAIPERSTEAIASSEAEAAGKTMNDENAARKLNFEETPASEMLTDLARIKAPAEGVVEKGHIDEKNDPGETKELPSVKPKVELVQNEYHIKNGGMAKDLLHFRSIDEPLGKFEMDFVKDPSPLPLKEVDDKPNEQSQALALVTAQVPEYAAQVSPIMKKEMRRKQSFKHIRGRIQRFFGLKEDDAAIKGTSLPHRFGSI